MNMNRMDILLWLAVQEDLGHADVTTEAVVDDGKTGAAVVIGRQSFVLSGTWPFRRVFELLDPRVRVGTGAGWRFRPGRYPCFQTGRTREKSPHW